mmetsp:Transcript_59294/g.109579  ORF Transcript_59294/g.109579 Transcript_59294/m.109579 type:complete len:203 (+) Transcript_59294:523-1131(+)
MSSARMHPQPSKALYPMRQSKRNWTPMRWCSRRTFDTSGSTTTSLRPSGLSFGGVHKTSLCEPLSVSASNAGGESSLKKRAGVTSPAWKRFLVPSVFPCKPDSIPPGVGGLNALMMIGLSLPDTVSMGMIASRTIYILPSCPFAVGVFPSIAKALPLPVASSATSGVFPLGTLLSTLPLEADARAGVATGVTAGFPITPQRN